MKKEITTDVKTFWENDPCGTFAGKDKKDRKKYFKQIEEYRYQQEPFIHSFAQFSRYRNQKILEVGMGAGTDFLQFCRSGANAHGVDLTENSIKLIKERLALENLQASIQTINAEKLPFPDNNFDLVYSFGVIHHSDKPQNIINEIYRILKPGAEAKIMLYNRYSWVSLQYYLKFGLFKLRPFRSIDDIMWKTRESLGTKVYSRKQINNSFKSFTDINIDTVLITSDYIKEKSYYERMKNKGTVNKLFVYLWPSRLVKLLGNRFGFYHLIRVTK